MNVMGPADPGLALRIYRQAMRRGADEKAALRARGGRSAGRGGRAYSEPGSGFQLSASRKTRANSTC
jgi:hypothetical protein